MISSVGVKQSIPLPGNEPSQSKLTELDVAFCPTMHVRVHPLATPPAPSPTSYRHYTMVVDRMKSTIDALKRQLQTIIFSD